MLLSYEIYEDKNGTSNLFYRTNAPQPGSVKVTLHFGEIRSGSFVNLKLKNDGFVNDGVERINSLSVNIFEALVHVKNPLLKKVPWKFFKKAMEYHENWKMISNSDDVPEKLLKVNLISLEIRNSFFSVEIRQKFWSQNNSLEKIG